MTTGKSIPACFYPSANSRGLTFFFFKKKDLSKAAFQW